MHLCRPSDDHLHQLWALSSLVIGDGTIEHASLAGKGRGQLAYKLGFHRESNDGVLEACFLAGEVGRVIR